MTPSLTHPDDSHLILRVVADSPDGLSIGDLLARPEIDFARRTLQRRIDQLVRARLLIPKGHGRARRYVLPPKSSPSGNGTPEDRDWPSSDAIKIRDAVNRPIFDRIPVGYRGEFLDTYLPNQTFYLPEDLRRELLEIGQVGLSDLPAGTYLRQVMHRLLIDLSWNSSRLEGNTYSLLETQHLLDLGEGAEGKAAQETQMILNHKAAIEMLAEQAEGIGFNRYTVCNLHALLSDNLLADPMAGGRIRSRPVGISGTVFHPLEVPAQIEERFLKVLGKAETIRDPFEQAFFAMVHLPYLQPFEDVNKRVSRLAANIPLIRRNLCPLSFIDVDRDDYLGAIIGVYELNRVEFLRDVFAWAYRRSSLRYAAVRQSLGDPDPFRLRHRAIIGEFVREIVHRRMNKRTAAQWIATETGGRVPKSERERFVEVVETELTSLHEGNIARYRLRPAEFESWNANWR